MSVLLRRSSFFSAPRRYSYADWIDRYDTLSAAARGRLRKRCLQFSFQPGFSLLLPLPAPSLAVVRKQVTAVQDQLYRHWQLSIAIAADAPPDVAQYLQAVAHADARVTVIGVSGPADSADVANMLLKRATGSHIMLLDRQTVLAETALFRFAEVLQSQPAAGIVYGDEDRMRMNGERFAPCFKPDWNPDLFLTHDYLAHVAAFNAGLLGELGGFRHEYAGAQHYDLALRCIERLAVDRIVHVPGILCHLMAADPADPPRNDGLPALPDGVRALDEHFRRNGIAARAETAAAGKYRVRYQPAAEPLVSLIIPTRNAHGLVANCIGSIVGRTRYPRYEILLIDNGSDDPDALACFAGLTREHGVNVIRDERPFNYSALNNAAAARARGEYLCLLNNDVEVIGPDWLTEMLALALQPGVGAVGARLWYPDDRLQHAGMVLGVTGVAGHMQRWLPKAEPGYCSRTCLTQTVSAVTAACMLVGRDIYRQVGGLDEVHLPVAFNDVDFCLRLNAAGYRNVWTPYAELYHHESASRGAENTPEKLQRFVRENEYMLRRWGRRLFADPAYNPNLALWWEDFSLAWPPRL